MMTFLWLVLLAFGGSLITPTVMMTALYWTGMTAKPFGIAPAWYWRRHPPPAQTFANNTICIFECTSTGGDISRADKR